MDVRYCSATTPRCFQKTIESRVNENLLEDLSRLAIPPTKFNKLKEVIKESLTQSEGWMFYEFPFKIQIHPCFSKLHIEFIGSTSEGLSISEVTDQGSENEELDLTAILQTIEATESDDTDYTRTWLEMQHCPENPGFVRLKVHMKDMSEHWCGLSNLVSNQDGSINEFYLSPVAFTDEFFLMFCLRSSVENLHYTAQCKDVDKLFDEDVDKLSDDDEEENDSGPGEFFIVSQEGPAVKTTILIANSELSVQYDCSLAIPCFEWPSIADEFKHRKRTSGLPSEEFVKRITSMGCLLVPKFPQDSKTLLEWRLSFCLVERELMLNLTDIQRRCYLLFKAIWRQFLCPPIGKALQSYHLKNVFLWECESVPLEDWTDDMMVARVTGLLQRLQYNLFTMYCPHYILRKNNLFKEIDKSLLFYAGMRVQTAIFQSNVVWIENDHLLFLPPHKSRTSLGRKLRNTCISALKYVIETMVNRSVKTQNKGEDTPKYEFDTESMSALKTELRQSFNENMTDIVCEYINSSLTCHLDNITRTYICSRADPKQLIGSNRTGLLDGLSLLSNVVMNWGNIVEVITSLEVLETENLKEYGFSEHYAMTEKIKLLLHMGIDDFGRFNHGESEDDDDENFDVDFGDFFEECNVCDECDKELIGGRFHCKTCPDFDLCENCILNSEHPHEFEFVDKDERDQDEEEEEEEQQQQQEEEQEEEEQEEEEQEGEEQEEEEQEGEEQEEEEQEGEHKMECKQS